MFQKKSEKLKSERDEKEVKEMWKRDLKREVREKRVWKVKN